MIDSKYKYLQMFYEKGNVFNTCLFPRKLHRAPFHVFYPFNVNWQSFYIQCIHAGPRYLNCTKPQLPWHQHQQHRFLDCKLIVQNTGLLLLLLCDWNYFLQLVIKKKKYNNEMC